MLKPLIPQPIRLVLRAAAWAVGLYAVLWLIATLAVGGRPANLDSERGLTNIYTSDVREFLYHLPGFCEQARGKGNLILVGGSTAAAYDPALIAPAAPGWNVSRVALDFGNITQMRQTVALLRQCLGPQGFPGTRIVLGVSYVSMAKNSNRFPTPFTMLELEQKRHGLFTGKPGALSPTVPWKHMALAVNAGRPVILAHYLVGGPKTFLANMRKEIGRLRHRGPPPARDPAAQQAEEIRFDDSLLGADPAPALAEQGADFAALIREVRQAGGEIVVTSIPEQTYLRQRSAHIGAYYGWLNGFAAAQNVTILRHPVTDADFRDGVHATPEGADRWSRSIAPLIAATLPASRPKAP